VAIVLLLAVIILLGSGARQMVGPFDVERQPAISLSPSALPCYALRTTMRIEEAVLMCDRLLVLASGGIGWEIPAELPLFWNLPNSGRGQSKLPLPAASSHVRHVLEEREGHTAPRVRFESELEDHRGPEDAERTLRTLVRWGRYAEIFAYDDESGTFSLDHLDK